MLPAAIDVQTARNPFEGHRVHSYALEGDTLETIILAQGLRLDGVYMVNAVINGELVPERMFPRVRPKAGTLVVLRVIPRGGGPGKGILGIMMGIMIVVATWGAAAPVMIAGLASGLTSIYSGVMSIVAPPPAVPFDGVVSQSQDSPALTGTGNSARLYGPIRTVLGQYRVYPDLLGKPFIETVGKDSILRMLLCFGYGPMDITDIRIGETPIENIIPASDRKVHNGWDDDDDDLLIFRDEVDFNGTVRPELPKDSPEVANLTTGAGPEEISLDIMFPGGLIAFKDNGKPSPVTVRFQIREREQGSTTWIFVGDPTHGVDYDTDTNTGVTKVSAGIFDIKLKERGTITRGFRWTVPAASTAGVVHEVQVTRVSTTFTVDNEDSVYSDAQITGIRTIRPHIASKIKNLAKIELKINASETGLSGVIDNISAICTSIAPKFDSLTQSWGPAKASAAAYNVSMFPTRNAAWLFAQVLRGPANSRPVEDSRIDGPGIGEWAGNLEGTGDEPISGTLGLARNLDAVVDYKTTARKILSDIAGAGRAALNIVDGKYSVVQDIPTDTVIQHFTPRNSRNFSGSKLFRRRPHAIRTHFVNPQPDPTGAKSYQKDEMVVYDDGYSEFGEPAVSLAFRGSTTPTSILDGGTGAAAAWIATNGATVSGNEGYSARLEITGVDPNFSNTTGNNLGIDTTGDKPPVFVRMKLRRVVNAGNQPWAGELFWMGTGDTIFSPVRLHYATEPDWSKGWVTLVWDMTTPNSGTWTGTTIDRVRFDLVHGGSSFGSVFDIESVIVDDGTQAATEFAELSLWGVADEYQAYRDGRYHLASTKLRPEIFSITTDVEYLVCNRGDLVKVSHDVIAVGYGAARLKSVTLVGNDFTLGEMDEEFNYESGKDYAIRIRGFDDSNDPAEAIINLDGEIETSSTVTPDPAYDWTAIDAVKPAVGDLVMFGERSTESIDCIVKSITPSNDLTATLELVEYNAAVYETELDIPAHNSNITLEGSPNILRPLAPVIVGELVSDETVAEYSASGTPNIRIVMNVSTPQTTSNPDQSPLSSEIGNIGSYAPTTHFHAQFRKKSESNPIVAGASTAAFSQRHEDQAYVYITDTEGSLFSEDQLIDITLNDASLFRTSITSIISAGQPNFDILNISPAFPPTNVNSTISMNGGADISGLSSSGGSTALTDWYNLPRVEAVGDTRITVQPVEEGEMYDIRVRSISDQTSTSSAWIYKINHTVIGLSTPPPAPTNLTLWGSAVRWNYETKPRDFAGFIVKYQSGDDATWTTGIPVTANLITDNWVQISGRIPSGDTTLMVRAVDISGNESTTLSAVKMVVLPDDLDVITSSTWTDTWSGTKTNCAVDVATGHLFANVNASPGFWSGGDGATYWSTVSSTDFYGLTIHNEMVYEQSYLTTYNPHDVGDASWPGLALIPGKMRFDIFDAEGLDYKIEYRARKSFPGQPLEYYQDWTQWPGERIMESIEFVWFSINTNGEITKYEEIEFRVTISSGTTRGKLKAARLTIEGLPKTHREIVNVGSTGGTVVDITSATTGKLWRKITNATITAVQDADSSQGGITGEMYDLLAKHEPGGTDTGAWELSGPKIRLWTADSSGTIETTGNAVVVIEGY